MGWRSSAVLIVQHIESVLWPALLLCYITGSWLQIYPTHWCFHKCNKGERWQDDKHIAYIQTSRQVSKFLSNNMEQLCIAKNVHTMLIMLLQEVGVQSASWTASVLGWCYRTQEVFCCHIMNEKVKWLAWYGWLMETSCHREKPCNLMWVVSSHLSRPILMPAPSSAVTGTPKQDCISKPLVSPQPSNGRVA